MPAVTNHGNHTPPPSLQPQLKDAAPGDAPPALTPEQARAQLVEDVTSYWGESYREEGVEKLLGLLQGGVLNLAGPDGDLMDEMPPEGWSGLDRYVRAVTGAGIAEVNIGPGIWLSHHMDRGMAMLPELQRIGIHFGPGATFDVNLKGLGGTCPQLRHLTLTGAPSRPVKIDLPAGVTVPPVAGANDHLQKSMVYFISHTGRRDGPYLLEVAQVFASAADAQRAAARAQVRAQVRDAVLQSVKASRPYIDERVIATKVDIVLRHAIKGSVLDLTDGELTITLVHSWPQDAWAALHAYATLDGGKAITQIKLYDWQVGEELVKGLKQLPALERADVTVSLQSGSSDIDFGDLHGQLKELNIVGKVSTPISVVIPDGARASAAGARGRSPVKPLVFYRLANGDHSAARPLPGIVHDNTARDFRDRGDEPVTAEHQKRARAINLNGKAKMSVTDAFGAESEIDTVCRHGAIAWCKQRAAYQKAKAEYRAKGGAKPEPFSYKPWASVGGVKSMVSPTTEDEYRAMIKDGASDMYKTFDLGSKLADKLELIEPGSAAHFLLGTPNHMLGCELRVRDRKDGSTMRREHVVLLFDFNTGALHPRIVPAPQQLRTMQMEQWLGADFIDSYFPKGHIFGGLYAYPETEENPLAGICSEVPDQGYGSPEFLQAAMRHGQVPHVRQAVSQLLPHPAVRSDQLADNLLARDSHGLLAAHTALVRGKAKVVAAYRSEILAIPDEMLDFDGKYKVLRGQAEKASEADGIMELDTSMRLAFFRATPDVLLAHINPVLEAPDDAITNEQRRKLLLSHAYMRNAQGPAMFCAIEMLVKPPAHWPGVRHSLWKADSPESIARIRAVSNNIRQFVRVAASSHLPLDDKMAVCISAERGLTSAQRSLDLDLPQAAAAMVLGILESSADADTKIALVRRLGIDFGVLQQALARHGAQAEWRAEFDRLIAPVLRAMTPQATVSSGTAESTPLVPAAS